MSAAASAARTRRAPPARRAGRRGVRWDRVGRLALLGTLGVILLLYVSPTKHWIEQSGTARAQQDDLNALMEERSELRLRIHTLSDAAALEREARRLGMVRQGERAYVIENLPAR